MKSQQLRYELGTSEHEFGVLQLYRNPQFVTAFFRRSR